MAHNKKHKSKFASKGEVAKRNQGRVSNSNKIRVGVKVSDLGRKGGNQAGDKARRQQHAEARRKAKNLEVLNDKRVGTLSGAPRIVGLIPMNESANATVLWQSLEKACGCPLTAAPTVPITLLDTSNRHRFTLVTPQIDASSEQDSLDVLKVTDIALLTLDCSAAVQAALQELSKADGDADDDDDDDNVQDRMSNFSASTWFSDIGLCITDMTRHMVSCINAQGCPTVVAVLQNMGTYDTEKKRRYAMKIHQRYFESVFPDVKTVCADTPEEVNALLRFMRETKIRHLPWREIRPYLLVEEADYDDDACELTISGFVRGNCLSATQLIHVTNHGTYQIKSITYGNEPASMFKHNAAHEAGQLIEESTEETRESLQHALVNDTLEDEQTWPTAEEEAAAEEASRLRRIRVPAGTSEYQAAWYALGDEGESFLEDAPEENAVDVPRGTAGTAPDAFSSISKRTAQTDVELLRSQDILRHERMTDEQRLEEIAKLRDEGQMERDNPDEVDTPFNVTARQRFSKYRGMKSFFHTPWDPKENLPFEYARIFQLRGYTRIRDQSIKQCESAPAKIGDYVKIVLLNVSREMWDSAQFVLIASGQLQHEQKWSTLHFQVQRSPECDEPIKSKSVVLAHIGFRKFYCKPLFSDVTTGNRTKYARYFNQGEKFRLATFFGPISYHPCPILFFKAVSMEEEAEDIPMQLCAFGAAAPPNPDLLIIKRVVLTGRISVIYKKQIVVKYMFFNPDDVRWFQPLELYSKLGRRGKILKPVGEHGLFKAHMNDTVQQHDIICMDLYKRIFPKWDTVPFDLANVGRPLDGDDEEGEDDDEWEDDEDE